MTQVIIGRRSVDYEKFVDAVKKATRLREVPELLGMNATVGSTRETIREKIEELGLDTSHFIYIYHKSEAFYETKRGKDYQVADHNRIYMDTMELRVDSKSWGTYKCSLGNFLESIGEQDFATVTPEQIENYTDKKNAIAHIRSMMITAVKENINGAVDKVSKEMLIWLI